MICRKCGQELKGNTDICPNCKSPLFSQSGYEGASNMQNRHTVDISDMNEQVNRPDIPDFYRKRSRRKDVQAPVREKTTKKAAAAQSHPYDGDSEDTFEKPKKGRGIISLFIGLAVALLLICTGIFSAYYAYNRIMGSSTSEYVESASKINQDINALNDGVIALFPGTGDELPVEDILGKIQESYGDLNDIIKSASEITAPSVYWDSHNMLTEALEQNKLMYKQLELILGNPADPEAQQNMNMLAKYIDEAMTNYTAVSVEGLSFSLPDEALSLPQTIQPWVDQKQAEYAQVMSLIEDFTQYFDNISQVLLAYDNAETDFNQVITSIRSGQESWDLLFSTIEENEAIVKTITSDYGKISVPSKLKSFNKRFGAVLDDLSSYYNELKFAAATERDFVTDFLTEEELIIVKEEINKLYQDAEKYKTSSWEGYQKFAVDMNIEKGKYLDPEYVLKLK